MNSLQETQQKAIASRLIELREVFSLLPPHKETGVGSPAKLGGLRKPKASPDT